MTRRRGTTPTEPVSALRFDVTCRACGGDLALLQSVLVCGEAKAAVVCGVCQQSYVVVVEMVPVRTVAGHRGPVEVGA